MAIGLIDIGGSSIKFGALVDDKLVGETSKKTPDNLTDFYGVLTEQIEKYKVEYGITGVGISSPGAVDVNTGIIGGASAIPYIHHFNIRAEFEQSFGLPVEIENDANCAALAEVDSGVAKGKENVVFLVLGSGVGGAVIINGKIYHGSHLLGGEFGYMLVDQQHITSELATISHEAVMYNEEQKPTNDLSGEELYKLAESGDEQAKKYVDQMFFTLGKTIFNLQYSIDPEMFVLGGGISNNPTLLSGVQKAVQEVKDIVEIGEVLPTVAIAHYKSEANLIGAGVHFAQMQATK